MRRVIDSIPASRTEGPMRRRAVLYPGSTDTRVGRANETVLPSTEAISTGQPKYGVASSQSPKL